MGPHGSSEDRLVTWVEEKIADLERQLGTLRRSVIQLKSGDLRLLEKIGSGPTVDITNEAIQTAESSIAQLERLVAVYKRSAVDG